MRNRVLPAATIILAGFLLAACQSLSMPGFSGEIVAPDDRIAFGQGPQSGEWRGENITVDFNLSGNQLSGIARFNDSFALNYQLLREFRLRAVFADGNGRIIGSQTLATNRGKLDPVPFRAALAPPPGTAGMTFGYDGAAFSVGDDEGGGGGLTSFWQYAVH